MPFSASATLFAGCCLLVATSLSLQFANSRLRTQLKLASEVELGETIFELNGIDPVTGRAAAVNLTSGGERPALVFVYSKCPAADSNLPAWRDIIRKAPNARALLLDLSGRGAPGPLTPVPTLASIDPATVCRYKFRTYPQTIVLNRRSEVVRVYSGKLSAGDVSDIIRISGG